MGRVTVADQTLTSLFSILLGLAFCVLYDLFRFFHKKCRGWWAVFISDLIFWLLAALVVFCFLIFKTLGQPRGYVLLGIGLGFGIGKLIFADRLLCVFNCAYGLVERVLQIVLCPLRIFFAFLSKICKKLASILKKGLKKPNCILYNIHIKKLYYRRKLWENEKSEK